MFINLVPKLLFDIVGSCFQEMIFLSFSFEENLNLDTIIVDKNKSLQIFIYII